MTPELSVLNRDYLPSHLKEELSHIGIKGTVLVQANQSEVETWCFGQKEVFLSKTAPVLRCSEGDRKTLESWAGSRTLEARLVERARIILRCLAGKAVNAIAQDLKIRPNTVIDWRRRFDRDGIVGLVDRPRSGKPRQYSKEFRNQILATLELPPPRGQASWDGRRSLNS